MKNWTIAAFACVAASITVPCEAQTAPVAAATQTLSQAEMRAVVEKTGELLTANYIYPDRAAEAKAKLDAALMAGEYESITTPEALAEKLTNDLQSVTHDKHVRVFPPPAPGPPVGATAAAVPTPQRVYAGFSRVDRLKGNIGYIKLLNFPGSAGPFGQTANQAIADLSGTDALIIDMRDNGGGSPDGVAYLCSFFFDPRTPMHINGFINRKSGTNEFSTKEFYTRPVPVSYLGKPVYLLTSKRTFSGGEEFLYDLQTQKRARLIGEVTGGGANPGGTRPLPFHFFIFIPNGRAVNPITKTNWEGTGVTPDLAVDETSAFQAAMREIVASNPAKYAALKAEVESQSAEDAFVESSLLKFRDQRQPGGEAAVRSLFSGLASGNPDYAQMSDEVANRIKDGLDLYHTDMSKAGEAKSVRFTGVGPGGLDNYELTTATSTVRFAVYLSPDGKIVDTNFGPPQPGPITGSGPRPGTETAVRKLIAGFAAGSPAYEIMSPQLAQIVLPQQNDLDGAAKELGAFKSLTFSKINPQWWDVYDAVYENGHAVWTIAPLNGGIVDGFRITEQVLLNHSTPHPDREASLRRYVESLEQGVPNYDEMPPEAAATIRRNLPDILAAIKPLGQFQSIAFDHSAPNDTDVYLVSFERGKVEWSMGPLTPDGKVTRRNFRVL